MSLTFAAQLADDRSAGGFQSRAVGALVAQAQAVLVADPGTRTEQAAAYARQFLRNPEAYARTAVWLLLGDAAVHATATPSDAVLLAAAAARWPYFIALG